MDGKVLLITGASSEIGARLIRQIAYEYRMIWAHYCHSKDIVEGLFEEFGDKIIPVQADFLDWDSTQKMADVICKSGDLPDHIVHLPAPKAFNLQFHKCHWNDYQKEVDISLRSIVMLLESFVPWMVRKKYGKVVFMLSSYVIGVPPKFQSPYITVKYALLGLMRNLASEYAGKGITVNAVSPDMMETKFLSQLPEIIIEQNAKRNPRGQNISIDEVISAFQYFLSEGANAVTGQNLAVTGG